MASFYKRGDYQWEAKIRKAGFPQLAKTFETKADAMAWAAEVETEMRRGTFVSRAEAERKTLGDLIGQYVEDVSPLHRGAESEIARLKAMARRKIAETAMANLRPLDIGRYRDERLKVDGVRPATVVREMGLLQRVIAHAIQEWGIALPRNPVQGVSRPKVKNARDRRFKPAVKGKAHQSEEARLLAACTADGRERRCRGMWLRPIVELAIATAMRQGEILALEWQHVYLEGRYAHLPETKNGDGAGVELLELDVGVEHQCVDVQRKGL
jgi:integrase